MISGKAFADAFVPDFSMMQQLRCDFKETVYNADGSKVSESQAFRIFRLDDDYQRLYLQKEPIDRILYYGADKIQFVYQSMTDDVIIMSQTTIDRQSMEYFSSSEITYDNEMFGVRKSEAVGSCKPLT